MGGRMIIHDFEGKPREFFPENYVKAKFDAKASDRQFLFSIPELLEKEFNITSEEDRYNFFREPNWSRRYLYDTMVIEIEHVAGRRIYSGGCHTDHAYTLEEIEHRLDNIPIRPNIIVYQYAALERICFVVNEPSVQAMPRDSIFKAVVYTYVVGVLRLPPAAGLDASKSSDVLYSLKRWGLTDNKMFIDAVEERVKKYRR